MNEIRLSSTRQDIDESNKSETGEMKALTGNINTTYLAV